MALNFPVEELQLPQPPAPDRTLAT